MAVRVIIPMQLRRLTDNQREVELEGEDINSLIRNLQQRFPTLRNRLLDGNGDIKKFIRIYKNEEDTYFLRGGNTQVGEGDVVTIVPAVLGG